MHRDFGLRLGGLPRPDQPGDVFRLSTGIGRIARVHVEDRCGVALDNGMRVCPEAGRDAEFYGRLSVEHVFVYAPGGRIDGLTWGVNVQWGRGKFWRGGAAFGWNSGQDQP